MKIASVNTYANRGGAARAALRLHLALRQAGVDNSMLVRYLDSRIPGVSPLAPKSHAVRALEKLARRIEDSAQGRFYPNRANTKWTSSFIPLGTSKRIRLTNPDLVHLHWLADGYVSIHDIGKLKLPIVWTMHDMWPLTGGCHYSDGCEGYQHWCGKCPILHSDSPIDISRVAMSLKRRAWKKAEITLVSPSRWLAGVAKSSSLGRSSRIEVIPNGVDLSLYRPHDRTFARQVLGLPLDKCLVLFGAEATDKNPRKGFSYLRSAISSAHSASCLAQTDLVAFGTSDENFASSFGRPVHLLGDVLDDVTLSLAYSAADVFVAPSVEENLANTVLEALACGTPCIAFNIGGMPDMIESGKNGILVEPYKVEDLREAIVNALDWRNRDRYQEVARASAVAKFDINATAARYRDLFTELIQVSNESRR